MPLTPVAANHPIADGIVSLPNPGSSRVRLAPPGTLERLQDTPCRCIPPSPIYASWGNKKGPWGFTPRGPVGGREQRRGYV